MGLSKREFAVLLAIHDGKASSQRDLAAQAGVSLGTVNNVMKKLREEGLADGFVLTEAGEAALTPYKVDNAIIMAADLSSRFVPLSYERPKGVLRVRGEALIERKIRQLKEAGVNDITVVVGYMKEALFYLEDAFGVKIRVNEQHASRNNNFTLMLVREQLGNAYICSSDDYFTENVFRSYVHEAYYAPNFLVSGNDMYLIDWEYSARSDYASDLGTFVCCSDYTYEEACRVFDEYFGRQTTPEELRHCLAYVALASYYWFVWALYKESSGDPVGEWLYLWHRYAKQYSALALERYEKA